MVPMSEREKMLAGALYLAADPELTAMRRRARRLLRAYNATDEEFDAAERARILGELLGGHGPGLHIEPPFYCDYGPQITVGERFYMNFGCVILDCAPVTIGDRVLCASNVQILAATHPFDPAIRAAGPELARPVTIGDDVWLGAGAIVCPGVTIGAGSIIGAGSVVTKPVPPGVIAVGNPCRVLRSIAPGEPSNG